MPEIVRTHAEVPEDKNAPCNLCGRGWPYHHDACAYKQTAIERDALAVRLNETEKALREEFFRKLPDLDYETDEGWAWRQHPWYRLLGLTDDECFAVLASAGGPTTEERRDDPRTSERPNDRGLRLVPPPDRVTSDST